MSKNERNRFSDSTPKRSSLDGAAQKTPTGVSFAGKLISTGSPSMLGKPANPDEPDSKAASLARSHGGSLRSKLVLSLAAMFFLFLTIDEMVRQKVIRPAFQSMERNGAIQDSNRVLAALNSEVQHLRVMTTMCAARLDLTDPAFDASQFVAIQPMTNAAHLAWAALIHDDGTTQWIRGLDEQMELDVTADYKQFLKSVIKIDDDSKRTVAGMTRIGKHSIFMFAAARLSAEGASQAFQKRPLDAANQAVRGATHTQKSPFLVFVREIDADLVAAIGRQTNVDFFLDATPHQRSQKKFDIWEVSDSTFVEVKLTDPFDHETASLLVDVPRDISQRSNQTSAMARQSFILGASAALLLLLLLLQRIVIGPLIAIREYSERVAAQGLETDPLVIARNDEIGELATAFQRMMQRLGAAQIRLASASRAAGMSQVADTVIHNVGNVLTNVNSLMESATDRVAKLRVEPIGKLADRLRTTDADDELRRAMPDYLHGLADSLEQDQRDLSELLTTLNDNIRHIHDVIRDQRRHATKSIGRQSIRLDNLVQEAIRCCQARLQRDKVAVHISGSLAESIVSDRSMLLQIVINIIGNARHALRESDVESRSLTINSRRRTDSVEISFRDNGCGMSESTLSNVFEAHYTTRDHGTGLGLHFCAITLKRLGGSIRAESEGSGKGSTFILDLPIADPAPKPIGDSSYGDRIVKTSEIAT